MYLIFIHNPKSTCKIFNFVPNTIFFGSPKYFYTDLFTSLTRRFDIPDNGRSLILVILEKLCSLYVSCQTTFRLCIDETDRKNIITSLITIYALLPLDDVVHIALNFSILQGFMHNLAMKMCIVIQFCQKVQQNRSML